VERFGDPFFDVLENVRPVVGGRRRLEILEGPPCAVVASSGMLSGGASPIYARGLLDGPEHLIAITGYQDEESPGRRLLQAAEGSKILVLEGQEIPVCCRVEKYGLSAHADGNQIAGLIRALSPSDTLLVHGDGEARDELMRILLQERLGRIHQPREGHSHGYVLGGAGGVPAGRLRATGIGKGPFDSGLLRQHLLSTYRRGASFTVEEIHRIWTGREPGELESSALEEGIIASPHLVADPRRPFHYAARAEEPPPTGPLEQNALLARVDEAIPDEGRLLRKSFQPGIPHLELYFAFPDRAARRYRKAIEKALSGTGWTHSIHPGTNAAALNQLITDSIPDSPLLSRAPSLRLMERSLTLWLNRHIRPAEQAAWDESVRSIEEESGFQVELKVKGETPAARRTRDARGRLEINLTYRRIKEAFQDASHSPTRIGLHPGRESAVIRLSFISPQVGQRYRDLMERLEEETGWPLRVGPASDQSAICDEARRLLAESGKIRRGPRFLARERAVAVQLAPKPPDQQDLQKLFRERTGYDLKFLD
jgi:hypothetical protein